MPSGPTAAVFAALKSFNRAATRRELEVASGLNKPEVDGALRVLTRWKALLRLAAGRRERGLYALAPGAVCPVGRGCWPRTARA